MKLHEKRTMRVLVAVLGAVAIAVFAVGASASGDTRWFVGMNLHFTGPDTTAGTFVMSGAVEDSGASHVENLSLVPIGNTDRARLSGD
jgi:ABC-type glycerol-3-phosphate transport system substrate-binding protein